MSSSKRVLFGLQSGNTLIALCLVLAAAAPSLAGAADARAILEETGVQGGLVVHVNCGEGELTAALRASDAYLVQGIDTDAGKVAAARKRIRAAGLYGKVTATTFRGYYLPYIDNLVNLVVAEDLGNVPMAEVMRVLCPNGVAYIKKDGQWLKTVKARPDDIDEWTHYLHDPSNNAVAHDDQVGPPRRMQWVGSPRWSRHHDHMSSVSAVVTTNGRLFYIFDEATRYSIFPPSQWKLIARDAFNGTILWKRPITSWHTQFMRLKSGPADLPRRLVAVGARVYATLDYEGPTLCLDAASGKTLRTYEGTAATQEIICDDGVLFLLAGKVGGDEAKDAAADAASKAKRRGKVWPRADTGQRVMAVDAESGRVLWEKPTPVAPLSLAASADSVLFYNGENIICLDRQSGKPRWTSPPLPSWQAMTTNYGVKLVLYKDVVLFSGGEKMVPHRGGVDTMTALSIKTGKKLWSAPHPQSGYQSPEDLLVSGGLVWSGQTTSSSHSGHFTGRDPLTGKIKIEFDPNVESYWFHHRCHMGKATDKYLLTSRTGIEFIDPAKKDWEIHNWVRGACLYGIMPANGLIYAPQHPCACYPEAKLNGFSALAAKSSGPRVLTATAERDRWQKGPAYGDLPKAKAGGDANDWPTFRGNNARSGQANTAVPAKLGQAWETAVGGKLSPVTVAGGKLFVASVDDHTVHALDAQTGKATWQFMAGARVDSPPTVWRGLVLFGSADGWVYCLRAADGELVWRFQGAPMSQQQVYFEQLESVWPVHGSVLVLDEDVSPSGAPMVQFVAGRSMFLDGGLRMYQLEATTGRRMNEARLTEIDPETGGNLQERHQVLQMPVALPDILASDGKHVYMKSQVFDMKGKRTELGPRSGNVSEHAAVQSGELAHLFSPTGYLDDSWWHRTYWVYGRSFAGGHNGYHRAGVFAPSGRILAHDDEVVYGFGRKPQYYRWTTPIEHQLFAASKPAADQSPQDRRKRPSKGKAAGPGFDIAVPDQLDPTDKALTIAAWIKTDKKNGVVAAHGGPSQGYALVLVNGQPQFMVRAKSTLYKISAKKIAGKQWTHLAGVLTAEKKMHLYVNGKLVASGVADSLITAKPVQGMQIGADHDGSVGEYKTPYTFTGLIDEVRLYHRALTADQIAKHAAAPQATTGQEAELMVHLAFDEKRNKEKGKIGGAMKFTGGGGGGGGKSNSKSLVNHHWSRDVPILVRAMVLTGSPDATQKNILFIAGPPDIVDESRLEAVDNLADQQEQLAQQVESIEGRKGASLMAISTATGETLTTLELKSMPIFDGMVAANGRLYMVTADGKIICYTGK